MLSAIHSIEIARRGVDRCVSDVDTGADPERVPVIAMSQRFWRAIRCM